MSKRIWKPLDVGGLRLYMVTLDWVYSATNLSARETYIVVAEAPRFAAKMVEDIYRDSYENNPHVAYWYVTGHPLNVLQPKDWDEKGVPCLECEPERCQR